MNHPRGSTPSYLTALLLTTSLTITGCAGEERPTSAAWKPIWTHAQQLAPTIEQLTDGGTDYCGQLLGQLRQELPELYPTPSPSIEPAVKAWEQHLRTIAFECPSSVAEIDEHLADLDTLTAEIDGGLEQLAE